MSMTIKGKEKYTISKETNRNSTSKQSWGACARGIHHAPTSIWTKEGETRISMEAWIHTRRPEPTRRIGNTFRRDGILNTLRLDDRLCRSLRLIVHTRRPEPTRRIGNMLGRDSILNTLRLHDRIHGGLGPQLTMEGLFHLSWLGEWHPINDRFMVNTGECVPASLNIGVCLLDCTIFLTSMGLVWVSMFTGSLQRLKESLPSYTMSVLPFVTMQGFGYSWISGADLVAAFIVGGVWGGVLRAAPFEMTNTH